MKTAAVVGQIVKWLDDYLIKAHQNGYVLGVSGGVDSAVTSTLAAKTGKPLLVLEMPIHQKENQVDRAQDHIEWLKTNFSNVTSIRVDLTRCFDELQKAVSADTTQEKTNLALANTRSRLRMSTLYYYAGLQRYLVCGTGNKVEDFGVGFFTKYGDGGVDLSPIADLLKSEVYALAKELNIIESIQSAKPTDGLWEDGRTDEDQMGATYDELEWAMSVLGKTDSMDLNERQAEVIKIFSRLNSVMQHKINPIPVCKISADLK